MRTKLIHKRYSDEADEMAYAYDLGEPAYFSTQFIATVGLDIEGLRKDDSVKALMAHKKMVYECKTAKEAISIVDKWDISS